MKVSAFLRHFLHHSLRRFPTCALLCAGLFAVGCQDVLTYSDKSRANGVELYNRQSYPEAAGAFNTAIRQNPRDYKSFYYLGCSYESMRQMQQAIGAYRAGLDVMNTTLEGKEDTEFRVKLINGLAGAIAKSDVRDIETNSAEADAKQKADGFSYLLLAKIHAFRGDADSAIEAFNHASMLEPNNFHIAKEYGLYLDSIGQTDRAEVPLRRAYALDPTDDQVNQALRHTGVVPGPSLKDEKALAKPLVPKGPIPLVDLGKIGRRDNGTTETPTPAPTPAGQAAAPRD